MTVIRDSIPNGDFGFRYGDIRKKQFVRAFMPSC